MNIKIFTNSSIDIKFLIILGFICANILGFFYSVICSKYNGDFLGVPVTLSHQILIVILLIIILQYVIIYFLFIYISNKIKTWHIIKENQITPLFYYFLLLFLIINFLVTYYYGFPVAGKPYDYKYAFLITRIKVTDAVFILYCLERTNKKKNRLFWILVAGVIILNLYRGWTIHLFIFASLELLIYFNSKVKLSKIIPIFIIGSIMIFFIYPKIYDLKIEQRGGSEIRTSAIDGLVHLSGRFSHFSQTAQIFEKKDAVKKIMKSEIGEFHYLKDTLSVLLPAKYIKNYDDNKTLHSYIAVGFNDKFDFTAFHSRSITGIAGKMIATGLNSITDSFIFLFYITLVISFFIFVCQIINIKLQYYSFLNIILFTLSGHIHEILYPMILIIFWSIYIIILNYIGKTLKSMKIS